MIAPTETLNIKEFVIKEPKNTMDLPFDPRRDIPSDAWLGMEGSIKAEIKNEPIFALRTAADMRFLSGNSKHQDLIPQLTREDWDSVDQNIETFNKEESFDVYLVALRSVREYDPERSRNRKYKVDDSIFDQVQNHVGNSDWIDIRSKLFTFSHLHVANPKKKINIPLGFWNELKGDYKKQAEQGWTNRFFTANFLTAVRILDPERYKDEFVLRPSWKEFKESLEKALPKGENYSYRTYAQFARQLMILSARDIKITENGLELKTSVDSAELNQNPTLPERRKF
jgi:hypothetical protein